MIIILFQHHTCNGIEIYPINNTTPNKHVGESKKKGAKQCGQSLKTIFEFLKNHHGNTIYQIYIYIYILSISLYTFKVATT
jgi:hypothetical protein